VCALLEHLAKNVPAAYHTVVVSVSVVVQQARCINQSNLEHRMSILHAMLLLYPVPVNNINLQQQKKEMNQHTIGECTVLHTKTSNNNIPDA
jgi:BarA-like signal transduction histidine kinase